MYIYGSKLIAYKWDLDWWTFCAQVLASNYDLSHFIEKHLHISDMWKRLISFFVIQLNWDDQVCTGGNEWYKSVWRSGLFSLHHPCWPRCPVPQLCHPQQPAAQGVLLQRDRCLPSLHHWLSSVCHWWPFPLQEDWTESQRVAWGERSVWLMLHLVFWGQLTQG